MMRLDGNILRTDDGKHLYFPWGRFSRVALSVSPQQVARLRQRDRRLFWIGTGCLLVAGLIPDLRLSFAMGLMIFAYDVWKIATDTQRKIDEGCEKLCRRLSIQDIRAYSDRDERIQFLVFLMVVIGLVSLPMWFLAFRLTALITGCLWLLIATEIVLTRKAPRLCSGGEVG